MPNDHHPTEGLGPPFDPSRNVLDLVAAAERRLDDLRVEAERLSAVKHAHSRELIATHAEHARELREAESKRLDAIRSVDVAAASVIANQVSVTAEALRALVSTTATTLAAQSTATFDQLGARISQLERTSYEVSGKAAVSDPAMARVIEVVEALRADRDKDRGGVETRQEGRASTSAIVAIAAVGVALVVAFVTILGLILRTNGAA